MNCIGLVSYFHSPGTSLLWWYPCLLSRFSSSSLARSPDCGKPYIPLLVLMYIDPSFVAFGFKLYSWMISSGMSVILMRIYSGLLSGVIR